MHGLTQSLMSMTSVAMPALAGFLIEHGLLLVFAWVPALAALGGLALTRSADASALAEDDVGISAAT